MVKCRRRELGLWLFHVEPRQLPVCSVRSSPQLLAGWCPLAGIAPPSLSSFGSPLPCVDVELFTSACTLCPSPALGPWMSHPLRDPMIEAWRPAVLLGMLETRLKDKIIVCIAFISCWISLCTGSIAGCLLN